MKKNDTTNQLHSIIMQPIGRRITISEDNTLLEAAQMGGVDIMSICGGIGACDSCKIRLISGELTEPTEIELEVFTQQDLENGYRLACQAYPKSNVKILIPPESLTTPQRLQLESLEEFQQLEPIIAIFDIEIDPPSISDLRSDANRIIDVLHEQFNLPALTFDYPILTSISAILRENNWKVNCLVRENQIISLSPSEETSVLGLAIDIGTTKLAAYLIDLVSGATLAKVGAMNPQIAFGEDVISRISYINHTNESESISNRGILQKRLMDALNHLIEELINLSQYKAERIRRNHIVDAVVVGNTAMHHIFAGFPVKQLGEAPYVASVSNETNILARDLGLMISPGARIYLPPNIAGYVGADHVAMLLATIFNPNHDYLEKNKTVLALDIGTNTEISLHHNKNIVCCSCASGPAFEGAHIRDGMRAADGAIERVQIVEDLIRIKTIGDKPAVGICGTGILDAIAEMRKSGILDQRGMIINQHPRIMKIDTHNAFVLVEEKDSGHNQRIYITRKDINQIQLAKGAIRAGINILLEELGIQADQIDEFIIAGAFGTYIVVENAINIGMFPPLPIEKFHQVGNAAGAGAIQMLLSKNQRKLTQSIIQRLQYIELSNHVEFTKEFSKALFFPDL